MLTGVELSEPHWHPEPTAALLAAAHIDRALGSVHALGGPGAARPVDMLFPDRPALDVVRDYLAEVLGLVESAAPFHILAHVDYAVRYWPAAAGPFGPSSSRRSCAPCCARWPPPVVRWRSTRSCRWPRRSCAWWADCGGERVSFGSDAHRPDRVGQGFAVATDAACAAGFRPDRDPVDLWWRPVDR